MGALRGFRTRLAHVDSRMACVVVVFVLFFFYNVYPTVVWSADRQSPVMANESAVRSDTSAPWLF